MKGMRNIAPFGLRMPDDLREAIAERAKANGRSMNSEIVQILQDAIDRESVTNDKHIKEFNKFQHDLDVLTSQEEKRKYLLSLEQDDPFAAALLRETQAHNERLLKILGRHMGHLEDSE